MIDIARSGFLFSELVDLAPLLYGVRSCALHEELVVDQSHVNVGISGVQSVRRSFGGSQC